MDQRIGFCSTADGVRIAYASAGGGPARPMVRVATWLTHLEHDTDLIEPSVRDVAADRTLLRYDMRGCGLSHRDVEDWLWPPARSAGTDPPSRSVPRCSCSWVRSRAGGASPAAPSA